MISVNLMDALQTDDDIERSVLSNIFLCCTQLTFDLIMSHQVIFRLRIYPYLPLSVLLHILEHV